MKITDYGQVTELDDTNIFLLDGDKGTKTIPAPALATSLLGMMDDANIMSKIDLSRLTSVSDLESGDKFLVGTSDGNKYLSGDDMLFDVLDAYAPARLRRTIFRGQNLGTAVTTAQFNAISDGTFKGLFLGDYWVIGGYNWRIVDFDYWYHQGDTSFTSHHVAVMPDSYLYTAVMNETNTTEGGYIGSQMYTTNLAEAKALFISAFGSNHVLTHREYLTNAVTSAYPSGAEWCDSTVDLPNEIMMYGCPVRQQMCNDTIRPTNNTVSQHQLALMQQVPYYINPNRQAQWLRDVCSATSFCYVNGNGSTSGNTASYSRGVRPVAAIG